MSPHRKPIDSDVRGGKPAPPRKHVFLASATDRPHAPRPAAPEPHERPAPKPKPVQTLKPVYELADEPEPEVVPEPQPVHHQAPHHHEPHEAAVVPRQFEIAQPAHTPHKHKRQHRRHINKRPIIIASTVVALAALIGGISYGTTLSLAPVYAGSVRLATGLHASDNAAVVSDAVNHYQFSLQQISGNIRNYSMADAGLSIDVNANVATINKQLHAAGPRRLLWWWPIRYDLAVTVNPQKLQSFTNNAPDVQAPVNATLKFTNGQPTIAHEVAGKDYTIAGGNDVLQKAVSELKPVTLTLTGQSAAPDITVQDVVSAQKTASNFVNSKITMTIAGKAVNPSPTDIANWIDVWPNTATHSLNVAISTPKVTAYIDSLLPKPVDQAGANKAGAMVSSLVQQLQTATAPVVINNLVY